MKVYEIRYTGISMGFLIMPQAYVEDERTQCWFKEFDIPPVEAVELDPSKVKLGSKSLQEIEQENISNMNEINWLQQGWECPKCGAVMSPTTACCVNCRGNKGGGVSIATGSPLTIDEWAKQQTSTAPSSICSTGSSESVISGKNL